MLAVSEIELRPMIIGYRLIDGVEEPVVNDDVQLLMGNYGSNGTMRQLGYIFKRPKPSISCCCVRCDDEELANIKTLVQEKTGTMFDTICQAPPPVESDEEETEEDDDEETE